MAGDSKTVSIPQITGVPAGETLVNIFQGNSPESNEENGNKVTFSSPVGSPSLTSETPLTVTFPFLGADAFTGPSGGIFGGYSTSDGVNSINAGFQVLLPSL
jgi:hypothetical protein